MLNERGYERHTNFSGILRSSSRLLCAQRVHAHIDMFVAHCACRVQCWDKVKDLDGSLENMLNVFSVLLVTQTLSNGTINGGN